MPDPARPTVYLETFGCQMNELDSELVTGALRSLGYRFTPDRDAADVLLYNTCSVREHAEQKVWSRLGEDKFRKLRRPELVVGVLGCMAERDGTDLIRRMPQVDILCGPGELDKLPALLDNAVRTRMSLASDSPSQRDGAGGRAGRDGSTNGSSKAPSNGHTPRPAVPGFSRAELDSLRAIPAPEQDRLLRSAAQVSLQGNTSRRSATLAAAQDTLELLDLSRAIAPTDESEKRSSAYVRITRGCNKFCTYCVVPFTRGAEVHRPPEHIIDECKRLADSGVIEVTLLGQTVNHYRFEHGASVAIDGITQPQKGRSYQGGHRADPFRGQGVTTFADLLARIHDEVPAIQRLRFVTSYPRDFGDDVLEVIRDHPRICRYLHVPAQSGSNRILQMMNRGYTVEEYLEFLGRARAFLHQPEIGRPLSLAGDIIVGFPTETEEDFDATRRLLELSRYKNCFIFKYSPRPGTPAFGKLEDDVPEETKRRRNNNLLALQQRISGEVTAEYVGRTLDVFVEGLSQREEKRRAGGLGGTGGLPASASADRAHGRISLTISAKQAPAADPHALSACELSGGYCDDDDASQVYESDAAAVGRTVQISARTDGDLIVHVDAADPSAAAELVGRIVPVTITAARPLALVGQLTRPVRS